MPWEWPKKWQKAKGKKKKEGKRIVGCLLVGLPGKDWNHFAFLTPFPVVCFTVLVFVVEPESSDSPLTAWDD